jgi:hypothetical protein
MENNAMQQTDREIAAWDAILDELERRRLVRVQKSGILSSICQNTEDDHHGRNDSVRAGFHGRASKARL